MIGFLRKLAVSVALLAAAMTSAANATSESPMESIEPELAWSSAVGQMDWSSIQPAAVDKEWLEVGGVPAHHTVVRGVDETIHHIAIHDHILPEVTKQLKLSTPWQQRIATRRIQHELRRVPIVVDQFSQTFFRAVDDDEHQVFTRKAVLLNLSKENIEKLAKPVRREVHRAQHIRAQAVTFSLAFVGIMAFSCWIGHAFLNRITKGYYVWPLRLTTFTVLLGSITLAVGITFSILNSV